MARFLDNLVTRSPAYSTVISRLQNGDTFVDIGCFLGQELRQIIADGAPTDRLHAVDVVNHWDLGYEFFRDADKFKIDLIEEDMMHPGKGLQALQGKMDIILVNQIFHQWVLEVQTEAAVELVKLSRPGSLIIGYQAGVKVPREVHGPKGSQYKTFLQSPETWKKMWDDVGERTGNVFKTEAKLLTWEELGHDPEETAYMGRDVLMMEFVITREK
ncbi:methyltransferase domain-containing protein [Rutstroemia sp. NJR-2017a BVV2]|nr:methyltransferase domain-containing protein [Rutstroemia sp. NJR-2017a BVV2]